MKVKMDLEELNEFLFAKLMNKPLETGFAKEFIDNLKRK
jgi:hypothetical protein